jgi:tRNA A37 threonylcarbamoyltransferase TsaD
VQVHYPPLALCTDNGAMIALAAALRWQHGLAVPERGGAFDVKPRWPLARRVAFTGGGAEQTFERVVEQA